MTLRDRLRRAFEVLSRVELDEQSRFGAQGETIASQFLEDEKAVWISNPILPHPTRPDLFLESDILAFTQGRLFCIEVKNFKGRITYPPRYHTEQIIERGIASTRQVEDGIDETHIVQEKMGNYGEGIFTKIHPNPIKKTKSFIYHLRRYLIRLDKRFKRVYIMPVAAFTETADIEAIHTVTGGIIYTHELPLYFKEQGDPSFTQVAPQWLQDGLYKVPTWDLVQTTDGEWINGVLVEGSLTFTGRDGYVHHLPYHEIETIQVERKGRFSAFDTLTIHYISGRGRTFESARGEVRLRRFGDELQVHRLRNVKKIMVGIANKPIAP